MMGFRSGGSREAERRGRSADVERTWLLPGHRLPRREFLTTPIDNTLFQKTSKHFFNSLKSLCFYVFLIQKGLKFQPGCNIDQPASRWLFRAAVGQMDFLLGVFMNLKSPHNALLNSRP
jgi:hypothetical protein